MAGPDVFGVNPYADNQAVDGAITTVLRGKTDQRGLRLEAFRSRAVIADHVHELMTTNQPDVGPGAVVDDVALIGFFRVAASGVVLVGTSVTIDGRHVGRVAGFDETHMPNHQNICLAIDGDLMDGVDLGLVAGAVVRFAQGSPPTT